MGIITLLGSFMELQFEKHQSGYLYRAHGTGPALPATAGEHDRFVRRAGINFLFHVAGLMVGVIAAAMLTAHWFPAGNEPGGFALMGGLLLAIGIGLYISVRRSMLAPKRALAGRAPVAPARPRPRPIPAKPAATTQQPASRGGCLLLIAFAIAEIVGGIGAGLLAYLALGAIAGEAARTIQLMGALVAGMVVVFLIDRQCARKTGYRLLDILSVIP
jgi:cytochrome c biogenesis protein CcdA